jgi:hypothetical protein
VGKACSTYEGGEVQAGFWWGDLRERDHLKNQGEDGRTILKCRFVCMRELLGKCTVLNRETSVRGHKCIFAAFRS